MGVWACGHNKVPSETAPLSWFAVSICTPYANAVFSAACKMLIRSAAPVVMVGIPCLYDVYVTSSDAQVLYDLGVVSTPEPFQRLVSQGMILGEVEYTAFQDPDSGTWVPEDAPDAVPVRYGGPRPVQRCSTCFVSMTQGAGGSASIFPPRGCAVGQCRHGRLTDGLLLA